jgi:hypothetical protein
MTNDNLETIGEVADDVEHQCAFGDGLTKVAKGSAMLMKFVQ